MGERGCRGGELIRFGGLDGVDNESGKRGLRSSSICQLRLVQDLREEVRAN